MASQFDESDFIDRDYQSTNYSAATSNGGGGTPRPPTRAELDSRVGAAQLKLAELRRAQEALERERSALEESRRRRVEFQSGREEMLQSLTRGVSLMEQAEFAARRDAEQMGKTLTGLREALAAVEGIHEETWTEENWNVELTRALASIENARLEWNKARLGWSLLNGTPEERAKTETGPGLAATEGRPFLELCRLGLALTWPVAVVCLIGFVLLLVFRLR